MKKILLAIALLIGMTTVSFGQVFGNTDGFFQEIGYQERTTEDLPLLPAGYSSNDQDAPLGTGLLILTALGAGYTLRKKLQK